MAVVDSSWLVAVLNRGDAHHAQATAHLQAAAQAVAMPVAVAEAMFVVEGALDEGTRAQRRKAVAVAIRRLLGTPNVRIREYTDLDAALALVEARPGLSLPDAMVALAARAWNQELWTFHEAQRRAFDDL